MIKPFQHLCEIVKDYFSTRQEPISLVQNAVPNAPSEWSEQARERYEQDKQWISSHYAELLSQYGNKGIAVYNQEVIASERDMEKLLKKVEERPDRRGVIVMYMDPLDRMYAFG